MNTTPLVKTCQVMAHEDGTFTADISDLGWNNWPLVILTEKGCSLTLARIQKDQEGDIQFAEYNYKTKPCLTVFND